MVAWRPSVVELMRGLPLVNVSRKPKPNPSSLQRCLGGPVTIPRLAHPSTTHKVPAWTTFLGIGLFGLALFWLHHLLGQYHWRGILAPVHARSPAHFLRARRFPLPRYGCLTFYHAPSAR